MSTFDTIAKLKRDVGVTDITELSEQEAILAELLDEREKATASLRKRLAQVEEDFNTEIDALADGKIRVSACGTYAYRIFRGGRVAKVDIQDAAYLASSGDGRTVLMTKNGYVRVRYNRRQATNLSHLIARPPPGFIVDHKNGVRWDDRRANLRVATLRENAHNRVIPKRGGLSESDFIGVQRARSKSTGDLIDRWQASLEVNGATVSLGRYDSPELAARAYDSAVLRLRGEYATTNESLGRLQKLKTDAPLVSRTDRTIELSMETK